MKNNRIAQQLRSLSLKPSLESEAEVVAAIETGPDGEGVVKVDIEAAETTPVDAEIGDAEDKDLTVKTVEVGERSDLESAETTVAASTESADVSGDTTTGDGEQIVKAVAEAVDETPADGTGAPGEDKDLTVKVVDVAESTETESAETASGDSSDLEVSQEGRMMAALAGYPFNGKKRLERRLANLTKQLEEVNVDLADTKRVLKQVQSEGGTEKKINSLKNEITELQEDRADIIKVTKETKAEMAAKAKVSQESEGSDAAVDAAVAFAEGAAGAAEAAATANDQPADVVTDIVEVVEEAGVDTAEEAEAIATGGAEIDALEGDIADGEAHAEEYEESAATMESLVDALRDAQQSGGLTQQSARFFNIGFESVGTRLTGKPFTNARGESAVPSLESFGGTGRRDHATQISLEAAGDWLKKIWEVLKKTFQQIKEWVLKFIAAVFDQGERYYQRADKILNATKAARSNAKATKVSLGRSGAKIAVGREVNLDHLGDLVKIAEEAGVRGKAASEVIGKIKQNINLVVDKLSKSDGGDMEAIMEAAVGSAAIADAKLSGDLRSAVFSETYKDGEQEGFSTKLLPGNVKLAVVNPATEDSIFKQVLGAMRGWRVLVIPQEGGSEEAIEVDTLSIFEIQQVANNVKRIIEVARKAKSNLKAEALDLGNVSFSTDVAEDKAKALSKWASATGKGVSTSSSSIGQLLKYAVGTSGYYLDYAAASLKQYGALIDPTGKLAEEQAAA